jgi:hypothetical protein
MIRTGDGHRPGMLAGWMATATDAEAEDKSKPGQPAGYAAEHDGPVRLPWRHDKLLPGGTHGLDRIPRVGGVRHGGTWGGLGSRIAAAERT